jgi:hypothetical protein
MPEPQLNWVKSSASVANGACVEMAIADDSIILRCSRRPDVRIHFTHAEIAAFFEGVHNGEFDHLIGRDAPSS